MADRRHWLMATARAVKGMTTRVTKKVRAMMARAMRVMTETSPREEGDNGHNNQLCTKVAAKVRIVVASNERQCNMDSSGNQDGQRSKITIDGSSGDGQRRRNGQQNGKTITMGKAARWEAMQDGWQR